MAALRHFLERIFHIVAQVIKAQLIIGRIGNVGGIGVFALVIVHLMGDAANPQPHGFMHLAHPIGIALRQIIIDRDHMHRLARQGI